MSAKVQFLNVETIPTSTPVVGIIQHEVNVRADGLGEKNNINNHGRAMLFENGSYIPVEVVRCGEKTTRIRRSLEDNGPTEKVETGILFNYRKVNPKKVRVTEPA